MGCGASKELANVVVSTSTNIDNTKTALSSKVSSPPPKSPTETAKVAVINPTLPSSAKQRQKEWVVRPGYSSGASSYSGSDADDSECKRDSPGVVHYSDSSILDLSTLRQEMQADGDLAKTMVRMETPFDTPIEEIYMGVLDGPVLGSGVSGIVRLVTHRTTGIKYAAKCLDLGLIDTTEGLQQLRDEIFIMCQLDHPNIVRIEEVYESANEIYIVQELCLGGDLFDRLDEQPDFHYTEAQCAKLVKQMLSALRYLHSKGIVHRDLKLENFLFSSTKPDSDIKMIDFGLSKHFQDGEQLCEKVGTPYTVAPEIIRGHYDEKCDIWAMGVITYLLLSGETPFGGLDGESMLTVKENIMRATIKFEPPETWQNVSKEGKHFILMLLNPNPQSRPTAKETQKSDWIQIWAKKDATEGAQLHKSTVNALLAFKESSDMQKLLSEVLSFTLMPEQIVDLRKEFEKMDLDGDGEISLNALKEVLMENAEAGALGALTEKEVEDVFDSIRFRKSEPTIRWHEFLAAGLSQARIDDRNLRLAFGRLDTQRKGFITFDDLVDILGNGGKNDSLEAIWLESLKDCKAHLDRITFEDFKMLMKGQPKEIVPNTVKSLPSVDEEDKSNLHVIESGVELEFQDITNGTSHDLESLLQGHGKGRSLSFEQKGGSWRETFDGGMRHESIKDASLAVILPTHAVSEFEEITNDMSMTPLIANRALYRKHREMRFAVLETSKQFDKMRNDIQNREQRYAGLIMKRGSKAPVEIEDSHSRKLLETAAKKCGRSTRQKRNKTVSDVTGMLAVAT